MKSYSAQLACIHVENYLYQLLLTLPEVVSGSTAITGGCVCVCVSACVCTVCVCV